MSGFDIVGNTFHAEDLDTEVLAIRQRILDFGQLLLMHLVQMDRQTYLESISKRKTLLIVQGANIPPAVLRRRPQRSHLKCFAF